MMDIAFNLGRGLQRDLLCANDARDFAADDYLFANHHTRHFAMLADDDFGALHVAHDLTVDLEDTLAGDLQVVADDFEIATAEVYVEAQFEIPKIGLGDALDLGAGKAALFE